MRQYIYTIIATAAVFGLSGCEKENAFGVSEKKGMINCGKLDIDYVNSGRQTRAEGENLLNDFIVKFVNEKNETAESFTYSEMPQMVTLPVGIYTAIAEYGEDSAVAQWNKPYYKGISETIVIEEDKVTDAPSTVMCRLQNIRVKVNADGLGSNVSENWIVNVNVGTSSLNYDKDHNGEAGYFQFVEGSNTITATFSGTINNEELTNVVVKTYDNAAAGNSYVINLVVNKPENEDTTGGIELGNGFTLDTTIEVIDENIEPVNPDKPYDEVITDDRDNDRKPANSL